MLKKYNVEQVLRLLTLAVVLLCFSTAMVMLAKPSVSVNWLVSAILLAGLLQIMAVVLLRKRIFQPLSRLLKLTVSLTGGSRHQSADKIDGLSAEIECVAANVHEATSFAVSIGNGNLETNFVEAQDNELRTALVEMRDKLRSFAEQEKKRLWQVNGQAKFSELLRQHLNEPDTFNFTIIKHLVQYLGCNQGGLYVLQEEEEQPFLELAACYAFERRKYQQNRIWVGEGLLGQCIREKDTIYLTDIPEDYIRITSGLGQANPRCILIVPLKVNDVMQGALELACFHPLEAYQVAFVETLAESIAASLANFKTNQGVTRLLEESQQLNQRLQLQGDGTQQNLVELRQTQEEMQQNVHMLQAAQQEMLLKQVELTGLFNSINLTIASAEFDLSGKITEVNQIFLGVTGYTREELLGKHEAALISEEDFRKPQHEMMWTNLKQGQFFSGEFKIMDKHGKELWLKGTYNPIFDLDGQPVKIMMLAQFTTDDKEKEMELSGVVNALKNTFPVLELNPDGTFRNANQRLFDLVGYKRLELRNQPLTLLLEKETKADAHTALMQQLASGEPFETELNVLASDGSMQKRRVNFNPLTNLEGKVHKIVAILA